MCLRNVATTFQVDASLACCSCHQKQAATLTGQSALTGFPALSYEALNKSAADNSCGLMQRALVPEQQPTILDL